VLSWFFWVHSTLVIFVCDNNNNNRYCCTKSVKTYHKNVQQPTESYIRSRPNCLYTCFYRLLMFLYLLQSRGRRPSKPPTGRGGLREWKGPVSSAMLYVGVKGSHRSERPMEAKGPADVKGPKEVKEPTEVKLEFISNAGMSVNMRLISKIVCWSFKNFLLANLFTFHSFTTIECSALVLFQIHLAILCC